MLRMFARLGARYMTLTHNKTLAWADAATDEPKHDGLTPFGERVVKEMNRLGMLVDISHVSPATMADALRVSKAPDHRQPLERQGRLADHPRNVPDEILKEIAQERRRDHGQLLLGLHRPRGRQAVGGDPRASGEVSRPGRASARRWPSTARPTPMPPGTVKDVADHIDHIVKVAGIDHVGIGSDFDGIDVRPRRPRRRLDLPSADRGTAQPRLFRGRHPQDPRRQRPPSLPQGRRGRRHAPEDHQARKSTPMKAETRLIEILATDGARDSARIRQSNLIS